MHGGKEIQYRSSLSNVALQIFLHFNAILSLLYAAIIGAVTVDKVIAYHRYTPINALALWAFFEPLRLYTGFAGNLTEKVNRCPFQTNPSQTLHLL